MLGIMQHSVHELTPTSYLRRLPGPERPRRTGRRQLMVLESADEPAAPEESVDAEQRIATFEARIDAAIAAFIGQDPFDVAAVLSALCGGIRQDDGTAIGSMPASELGWTLLAAGIPTGPARHADLNLAVASAYDDLKAAVFLGQPR